MTIPSPAPGGGVYTGLDPFGRPALVTNYALGPTGGYGRINVWQFYQEMDQGNHALMINRALAAIAAQGGGVLFFPAGTYTIGTTIVMPSNVILVGEGVAVTILQAAAGLNNDVIQGQNFATLTGTNGTGGILNWSVRDLTIDGNKANNTSGYGLRVYGYLYKLLDLEVRNCANDGLYSEWSTASGPPDGGPVQANYVRVRSHDNLGHGIQFAGPHDATWESVLTYQNGTNDDGHAGIYIRNTTTALGGRVQLVNCHSWGNSQSWALNTEAAISTVNSQWEGAQRAQVLIGGSDASHVAADCILDNDVLYAAGVITNPVGVEIGVGAGAAPGGYTIRAKFIGLTSGAMKFTNDAGNGLVEAQVYQTSGSLFAGSKAASTILTIDATGSVGPSRLLVRDHLVGIGTSSPSLGTLQTGISTQSIAGNDICGTITLVTTASPPGANAMVAIVNFATAFDTNAPIMFVQQAGNVNFYWSGATTALFNVFCGAALAATTTYFIHYLNVGRL